MALESGDARAAGSIPQLLRPVPKPTTALIYPSTLRQVLIG